MRIHGPVEIPLDPERLAKELAAYETDPSKCNQGEWVDEGFAKAVVQ